MRYSDALSEFEEEWEDEAEDADGGWAAELSDEDGQEYDCAPPPPSSGCLDMADGCGVV